MQHLMIGGSAGSPDGDELGRVHARVDRVHVVAGRCELEAMLGVLLHDDAPRGARSLDFIGHSTSPYGLLRLGAWTLDAANPTVAAFFRELHDQDVLPRLGVTALRLLGAATAGTPSARWTICALADMLGVEVYGTTTLIGAEHFHLDGFAHDELLVSSRELRNDAVVRAPPPAPRGAHLLDVDGLAAIATPGPRLLAAADARAVLALIERTGGRSIPGLLAAPRCELALPATTGGHWHRLDVLAGEQLVRVFPGPGPACGVVYTVRDARALGRLIEALAF